MSRKSLHQFQELFEQGGPLAGKKEITYPIKKVYPDGKTFDIKDFVRGDTKKEESGLIALIHTLGWPDKSPHDFKVDAIYYSLKLAFEIDEVQHMDSEAYFNKLNPNYQKPRDHRINLHFAQQGYYIVRILAADPVPDPSHEGGYRWIPVSNHEVAKRAIQAVSQVLNEKKVNMEQNKDYAGKVLVWPDTPDQTYGQMVFGSKTINEEAKKEAKKITQVEIALRKGTIVAQEMAMKQTQASFELQNQRTHSHESLTSVHKKHHHHSGESTASVRSRFDCRAAFVAAKMRLPIPKPIRSDLPQTLEMINLTLVNSSCEIARANNNINSKFSVPKTKPSAFELGSLFGSIKLIGNSQDNDNETEITEYEKTWKKRMLNFSPQDTYKTRVRNITLELTEFTRKFNR